MSNATVVRAIGAGERKLGETADMLAERAVSEISDIDYFDSKSCAAAATATVRAWLGDDADERQMNPDKSKTDFGRGFGSLVSAVKGRLKVAGATDWLRLVVQAADNAADKGGFSNEEIINAIMANQSNEDEQAA